MYLIVEKTIFQPRGFKCPKQTAGLYITSKRFCLFFIVAQQNQLSKFKPSWEFKLLMDKVILQYINNMKDIKRIKLKDKLGLSWAKLSSSWD